MGGRCPPGSPTLAPRRIPTRASSPRTRRDVGSTQKKVLLAPQSTISCDSFAVVMLLTTAREVGETWRGRQGAGLLPTTPEVGWSRCGGPSSWWHSADGGRTLSGWTNFDSTTSARVGSTRRVSNFSKSAARDGGQKSHCCILDKDPAHLLKPTCNPELLSPNAVSLHNIYYSGSQLSQ